PACASLSPCPYGSSRFAEQERQREAVAELIAPHFGQGTSGRFAAIADSSRIWHPRARAQSRAPGGTYVAYTARNPNARTNIIANAFLIAKHSLALLLDP